MALDTLKHNALALARCRVLYIGTALPTETAEGSEAVQKPLRERYNKDGKLEGIDSRLIVYSNGIQLQFIDDQKTVIWFPILSLNVCAAVKCVNVINAATGGQGAKFVPLDNITSELKDVSPPIFAMITRRVRGIKILECHMFVCKSDAAAMALVQCCTHAYEGKELDGTTEEDALNTTPMTAEGDVGYRSWVAASQYKEVPTAPGGYYIGEGESLVKNYGIWSNSYKTSQRARTLGPSHLARGGSSGAAGTLQSGTPRLAYVPASMIKNINRQTGAGTIDASTLNKYLRAQPPARQDDDTKSFYMYPQDKPQVSYWQAQSIPKAPISPGPPPDYDRPNNTFSYPPKRLPSTPEYAPGAEPRFPSGPYVANGRDPSPPRKPRENGAVISGPPQRPRWDPNARHPDGRPLTPPPDYDIEGHFDGYWHGYNDQQSKRNLNDLMKKRASQALDESVQEEFLFKRPNQKEPTLVKPKWKTGSKVFSNEMAFSRSIQKEMDAKPGSKGLSAYELLEKDRNPYEDLDSTLGYLP